MPRARNIKPSLFENEKLGDADPLLTILFTGLWCLADREGRMEYRPKRIRAQIFPYRLDLDINGLLTELERLGFTRVYTVDNFQYLEVLNFLKHQRPHHTEKDSVIPPPPEKPSYDNDLPPNGGLTVKPPCPDGENPPDLLIPDTLNTLSNGSHDQYLTTKENIVFDIKKDEGIEIPGVVYCGGLKKFPMHENWQPDTNEFITACFRYGIKKEEITQDVILNFVDYWSERTDIKTESGWCKKLVSDFKMYKGRVQSHERSKKPVSRNTNRSKYHDIHEILENSEDE